MCDTNHVWSAVWAERQTRPCLVSALCNNLQQIRYTMPTSLQQDTVPYVCTTKQLAISKYSYSKHVYIHHITNMYIYIIYILNKHVFYKAKTQNTDTVPYVCTTKQLAISRYTYSKHVYIHHITNIYILYILYICINMFGTRSYIYIYKYAYI